MEFQMFLARSDVSFLRDALIVMVIDDVIIERCINNNDLQVILFVLIAFFLIIVGKMSARLV